MKHLALFSTLACATVLLSGCMDTQETTTPTDTTTGITAPIETTTGTTTSDDTTITTGNSNMKKKYSLSHISSHSTASDCRTAINGTVYDITAFFSKHPGGDANLLRTCGIDATQVFNSKHGGDTKPNNVLAGFEIGILAQ